jgi:hypothetical protein
MRRWLRGPILAAAAALLLGNDGLQLETLLRDFEIVAFGAEYQQKVDGRLHKWTQQVRVYIDTRAGDPVLYRRLTASHLDLLEELTGLQIGLVEEPDTANVVIVFDRNADLIASATRYAPNLDQDKVMLGDALCFGQYSHNSTGAIVRGVIGIPSDRATSAGKLPACIVEEITQVLGLPNDSDEVNPSIFNDRSVLDELSAHDRVLVRLLYDRRLPAGMSRDKAMAVAREILREQGF